MINGLKYYKINKELFESGYLTDIKCAACKGKNITPDIRFPYRMDDVCFTCKTCNTSIYYQVFDVMYYYMIYKALNKMVGKNVKPGEVKNITDIDDEEYKYYTEYVKKSTKKFLTFAIILILLIILINII